MADKFRSLTGEERARLLSFQFAIAALETTRALNANGEFIMASAFLRAALDLAAHLEQAAAAIKPRERRDQLRMAFKKTRLVRYWLRLLVDSNTIGTAIGISLLSECDELCTVFASLGFSERKQDSPES